MRDEQPLTPRPRPTGLRPAIWAGAVGSVTAGWVHLAAARNHEGDRLLTGMFVATAVAQVGVGLGLAMRPRQRLLMLVGLVNGGAVLVWALTRTVGIAPIGVLATVEDVGTQDLGAALFGLLAVAGVLIALVRPMGSTRLRMRWAAVTGSMALLAALPAMAAEHAHSHPDGVDHDLSGEHAHADGEDHAGGEGHADGEAHEDGEAHADGEAHEDAEAHADGEAHGDGAVHGEGGDAHGHTTGGTDHGHDSPDGDHGGDGGHVDGPDGHGHPPTTPGDGDHGHPPTTPGDGGHGHPPDPPDGGGGHEHPTDPPAAGDPITSLEDPRLTQAQWDAAVALIAKTTVGMRGFVTEADVEGAGYVSMGDGGSPGEYTHYVNWAYLSDAHVLDQGHIEAIVMKMNADGSTRVVAAMYILSLGDTLWDAPYIAGELTTWHDHGKVCLAGEVLLAPAADGSCPAGVPFRAPPMLHVWVEANGCGPFIDVIHGGADCGAIHH